MTGAASSRRVQPVVVPTSERARRTYERIVESGAELLHGFPVWNWSALTVPAVAARAGVTERTVYRYFASERGLRDAVMERLSREARVAMNGLALDDVAEVARRILEYSSTFPLVRRTPRDETVAATNAKQRRALVAALRPHTQDWSRHERNLAAAMLDVLWSVTSYERLVDDWGLRPVDAIQATTWAINLIVDAVRTGAAPGTGD